VPLTHSEVIRVRDQPNIPKACAVSDAEVNTAGLVDALVDALISLGDGGVIWLLTPKAGRPGHVEPSDIGEAAPTAGLNSTSSTAAARDWSGTRLVPRGANRR